MVARPWVLSPGSCLDLVELFNSHSVYPFCIVTVCHHDVTKLRYIATLTHLYTESPAGHRVHESADSCIERRKNRASPGTAIVCEQRDIE